MPYTNLSEVEFLIQQFEQGSLPRSQWTHTAHLTVALWYLTRLPFPAALNQIRRGIQHYNAEIGIPTTAEGGYHETLTCFWVRRVQQVLEASPCQDLSLEWLNQCLKRCGDKALPSQYYSHDRLYSWRARTSWVDPDLKSLESTLTFTKD